MNGFVNGEDGSGRGFWVVMEVKGDGGNRRLGLVGAWVGALRS